MSNSAWVNKLHSQLPLNLQEERVKDVLIGIRLRHEVHRVFSIGNRSLVVDFTCLRGISSWSAGRASAGGALTWVERNAAYVDIKFKKLKEDYPGICCFGFVEARQVDQESLCDFVGAIMAHADVMSYSMEELAGAIMNHA